MGRLNKINTPAIFHILSFMLMICGGMMLIGLPFSIYYNSGDQFALLASAGLTSFSGYMIYLATRNANKKIRKREAFLIVALAYFVMSLFGSLPYLFSQSIPNFTNAYFEAVSGFTTTGSSILDNIEQVPQGVLIWRSLTQWIGGMGIILLTTAILPYFGIGGVELFAAEVPGPSIEKLHPRIAGTIKRLWGIYFGLTAILMFSLYLEGMTPFDAFNHSLTTLSTGGFSTHQESIGYFDSPIIQYTIILFMFLAGMNFTLHYMILKGNLSSVWQNQEFKGYSTMIGIVVLLITSVIILNLFLPVEEVFRGVLFSVISIVTSTGFVTVDYTKWLNVVTIIFFLLLFSGGSAGSTSGGIKTIRHLLLAKTGIAELKRSLHPHAIIPVRYNGKVVDEGQIHNVLAFIGIYGVIFLFSTVFMAIFGTNHGMDLETSMSCVATSLGNVGPGIGEVGPANNFNQISTIGKWYLDLIMVTGRLELFTVVILFTPYFWSGK